MYKPTWKRMGLGLLQHLSAFVMCVAAAAVVFNSYVVVNYMNGETAYYNVEPFQTEKEFEDSELFDSILKKEVQDIMRLVVIRGQLESNNEFNGKKVIDVTKYATRKGSYNECPITAYYKLDDLIKWGIYGVSYNQRTMSMMDFINYFSDYDYQYIDPAYFAINNEGQLYFKGFDIQTEDVPVEGDEINLVIYGDDQVWKLFLEMELEDLEYLIFTYIVDQIPENVSMSREEDGILNVYVNMLNCRYGTADGGGMLTDCAHNWVDYLKLQRNLVETIESLQVNYNEYQESEGLYQEENSNLKYLIRMSTEEGVRTFTNVSSLLGAKESDITEMFAEYQKYFVYYPNSLEFTGNTELSEKDVAQYMKEYEYAYPENTHIWIGVDTTYPVVGDDFYNANAVFQKIVPHANSIVTILAFFMLAWVGLGVYLTVTAGVAYREDGTEVHYLNPVDRIWTEIMILFVAVGIYLGIIGFQKLSEEAFFVYLNHMETVGIGLERFLKYALFGLYGFAVSLYVNIFWYSLVRRVKSLNLWTDSLMCTILRGIKKGIGLLMSHSNLAISTLLPYNVFLLLNLASILAIYMLRGRSLFVLLTMIFLVLFDGLVGMMLFKNSAERKDITDGISRIRNGEVDYRLNLDSLHGINREMADAVNNIGEGISKAVSTSVKDEQMKTDLITNVSHDIKTPLTSIINYVGLLKALRIKDEPIKGYIDVLDTKSQRLKQLTDDLVEASKLSSGNVVFEQEQLNVTELLNQSIGEFVDRLEEKGLKLVFEGGETPVYIFADSRRMWRVIENLFNNIYKYALENTRVYIDLEVEVAGEHDLVRLSFKNISERQMNIKADDLTERFIRGDSSRTSEGSGLGLYIAKNLIEGQGGTFAISLDGDLFKVSITFPEYVALQPIEEADSTEGGNTEAPVVEMAE